VSPAPATLPALLDRLEARHGRPPRPLPESALDWILWENAAYLVPDERRAEAYAALRAATGLRAEGILGLPRARLLELAALGGRMPERRVDAWIAIAERVQESFKGQLERALSLPVVQAQRALKKFPGIGAPGADKILLFTGTYPLPALDSSGVRVLVRLGLASEGKSYAATYGSAVEAFSSHRRRGCAWLIRAHELLRAHGRTLCNRTEPRCGACPLSDACPSAS